MPSIKILYNSSNYSNDDFPSKFKNEEVSKVQLDINSVRNNPNTYIQPLDIVKMFKKRPHRKKRVNYMVHACIYLGNKKISHVLYNRDSNSGIIKIDDWDNFFNIVREGIEEKIICYHPAITFKNQETIIEHIAKCIENNDRYFNEFGEFSIEEKQGKRVNNCESFTNRCVLGLDFSELSDYRKKLSERLFECLDTELENNKSRLDSLITNEQVSDRINEINNYRNQVAITVSSEKITNDNIEVEAQIEVTPTNIC